MPDRPPTSHRRHVWAFVGATLVILAGCTGGDQEVRSGDGQQQAEVVGEGTSTTVAPSTTMPRTTPSTTTTIVGSTPRTAADLREAARRTAEWDRGRMRISSDVVAEGEGAASITAELTFVGDDMSMSMSVDADGEGLVPPSMAGFGNYELVAIGERFYMKGGFAALLGGPVDRWVVLPTGESEGFTRGTGAVTPSESLDVLDALTGTVTPLGPGEIDGRSCQRVGADVPLSALADRPDSVWSDVAGPSGATEGTARMEAWVCDQTLAKVRIAHAGPGLIAETSVEFLPLGAGVRIEAPADAVQLDPSQFLAPMFEGIGSEL